MKDFVISLERLRSPGILDNRPATLNSLLVLSFSQVGGIQPDFEFLNIADLRSPRSLITVAVRFHCDRLSYLIAELLERKGYLAVPEGLCGQGSSLEQVFEHYCVCI